MVTPVPVDTIFRIGKVRRIVSVVRTGKVVVPVNVADARLVVSVITGGEDREYSRSLLCRRNVKSRE
jgi:hypothetical protein